MQLRQTGVTITIHRSLNKEAALKSLRDASAQLKKVAQLQDDFLLGDLATGLQVFSMLNLNDQTSTQNKDAKQGKELEDASKLAVEMRLLAERAAILLAQYVASNSDANENENINKVIAEYKGLLTEALSIGLRQAEEAIANEKPKLDSSVASSSKLDSQQAKSDTKDRSAERTSYGLGSSAMYSATALSIIKAAKQDKARQDKIMTP